MVGVLETQTQLVARHEVVVEVLLKRKYELREPLALRPDLEPHVDAFLRLALLALLVEVGLQIQKRQEGLAVLPAVLLLEQHLLHLPRLGPFVVVQAEVGFLLPLFFELIYLRQRELPRIFDVLFAGGLGHPLHNLLLLNKRAPLCEIPREFIEVS